MYYGGEENLRCWFLETTDSCKLSIYSPSKCICMVYHAGDSSLSQTLLRWK